MTVLAYERHTASRVGVCHGHGGCVVDNFAQNQK